MSQLVDDEGSGSMASPWGTWQARRNGEEEAETAFSRNEEERHPRPATRPVKVSATVGNPLDTDVVSYSLYNSFNYSVFVPGGRDPVKLSFGITSPNPGEGKTTAVCNLAAALSIGSGRKTVVVDMNVVRPRIHEIFGTPRGPGLSEALIGNDICVVPTSFDNLFVMPIGNSRLVPSNAVPLFREVLASLFNHFEFVFVDMPPTATRFFPTLIANQLSGLLVVLRSRMTKRRDVSRLFLRVREEKVLGFLINGVSERDF